MRTSPLNARRRLAFAISALVIAILVFSSCVWLSGELLRPIPPARTPAPTSIPTQLGGGDGLIAFESRRDGNSEIYVMNADGSGQRNLTNSPAEDVNPVWSPDGTWLAFFSDRSGGTMQVHLLSVEGLPSGAIWTMTQQLTDKPRLFVPGFVSPISWAPEGTRLIIHRENSVLSNNTPHQLFLINADGSGGRFLFPSEAWVSDNDPQWSPDSHWIAFSRNTRQDGGLYIGNVESGELQIVQAGAGLPYAWSPDGRLLVYGAGFELKVFNLNSQATHILREPAFSEPGFVRDVVWSPDGTRLAFSFAFGTIDMAQPIFLMWSDGSALTQITPAEDGTQFTMPNWSPDGRWLMYITVSLAPLPTAGVITEVSSILNIYALDVRDAFSNPDSLKPVQLTTSGQDFNPQWQP